MKRLGILVVMLIVLLAGCGKSETVSSTVSLTSSDYVNKFIDAGLSIGEVIDYTAETDPNELLGRPNQYTSKTNFADASLNQDESDDPVGAIILAVIRLVTEGRG